MARFQLQVESPAAVAVDTGFGWLMASANNGFKLRRFTLGVRLSSAAATGDFQAVVGINRVTTAGTTPVAGMVPVRMWPWSAAAGSVWNTSYSVVPTLGTADAMRIPLNTKAGVDLPWELFEDFVVLNGTTNGLAFVNRDYALPANTSYVMSLEFEE